jgi:hypothetical protein
MSECPCCGQLVLLRPSRLRALPELGLLCRGAEMRRAPRRVAALALAIAGAPEGLPPADAARSVGDAKNLDLLRVYVSKLRAALISLGVRVSHADGRYFLEYCDAK